MIMYSHAMMKIKSSNQALLFGSAQIEPPPIPKEVQKMKEWEEPLFLSYEKEVLGFYLSGHPLSQFRKRIKGLVTHFISQLDIDSDSNMEVCLAGIITSIRPLKTRKEERMATFMLEDMTGRVEVVAFPESYSKGYQYIQDDLMVWIKGSIQGNGESSRLQLEEVMPLTEALKARAKRMVLHIKLASMEASVFEELKNLLRAHTGNCPVFFELEADNAYQMLVQSLEVQGVDPSEDLTKVLEDLLGENTVNIQY
jgi:DNA polymerase-3 subunit alpha